MNIDEKYDENRKIKEYEMKITRMAGHLADYYIDRAIESDDFSFISSFLIDYFSGHVGKAFEIGYLVSKYKEYELNEKIEDIDFNMEEWYRAKYEKDNIIPKELELKMKMTEKEYLEYMIEKRKSENSKENDS
jgi:hypothetical protein